MGFHICEYCKDATSSGDVILEFEEGTIYKMPDMILHYIADHGWVPDAGFMNDVMNLNLSKGTRFQTKGIKEPTRVGYLSGPLTDNPRVLQPGFFMRLWSLMQQAQKMGRRMQTRGI